MKENKGATQENEPPVFVTPAEAARLVRVSERTVTRLCKDGTLKAVKVRKQWRVNRESLLAYCGIAEKQ